MKKSSASEPHIESLTCDAVQGAVVGLTRPDGCADVGKAIMINAVCILVQRGRPDPLGAHTLARGRRLDVLRELLAECTLGRLVLSPSCEPGPIIFALNPRPWIECAEGLNLKPEE